MDYMNKRASIKWPAETTVLRGKSLYDREGKFPSRSVTVRSFYSRNEPKGSLPIHSTKKIPSTLRY